MAIQPGERILESEGGPVDSDRPRVSDSLKAAVERELARAEAPAQGAKFSQVSHNSDGFPYQLTFTGEDEDTEEKVREFAERLARVSS